MVAVISMKFSRPLLLTFLLALAWSVPFKPAPPEPIRFACNTHIMRSYMLKGRESSVENEPHLTCPDIKNNCCTKYDQQKIFHFVNDIFERRFEEYNAKVLAILARFQQFHRTVTKSQLKFRGSIKRQYFCSRQAQRLIKFPFETLYDNLVSQIEGLAFENKEFHKKFFCILCDGENHRFMELEGLNKKIMLDMAFCKEHLTARSGVLKLLNVDLQEYLINLQNVVDCKHYAKSYSLRFYDMARVQQANTINECINYMETPQFFQYCRPICEKIKFSKIFEMAEGDLEYLTETLAVFEKSFAIEEDGFVASTEQVKFFQKMMKKTKKGGKYARSLVDQQPFEVVTSPVRNELEDGLDSDVSFRMKMKGEVRKFHQKMKKVKTPIEIRRKISQKRKEHQERRLIDFDGQIMSQAERVLEPSNSPSIFSKNKKTKLGGRVLAEAKTSGGKKGNLTPAKPFYNSEFPPVYNEIIPPQKPDNGYVWLTDKKPIDFDLPLKVYQINLGINPEKYGSLNFTMSSEEFYNRLFKKVKHEKMNVDVQYLLGDFTQAFWDATVEEMIEDFAINMAAPEDEIPEPADGRNFFEKLIGLFKGEPWTL